MIFDSAIGINSPRMPVARDGSKWPIEPIGKDGVLAYRREALSIHITALYAVLTQLEGTGDIANLGRLIRFAGQPHDGGLQYQPKLQISSSAPSFPST